MRFTDDKPQLHLLITTPQQNTRITVLFTMRSLNKEGLKSRGYASSGHRSTVTLQALYDAVWMCKASSSRSFSNTLTAITETLLHTTKTNDLEMWTDYQWLRNTYKIFCQLLVMVVLHKIHLHTHKHFCIFSADLKFSYCLARDARCSR